jgi:hypothetical protein
MPVCGTIWLKRGLYRTNQNVVVYILGVCVVRHDFSHNIDLFVVGEAVSMELRKNDDKISKAVMEKIIT